MMEGGDGWMYEEREGIERVITKASRINRAWMRWKEEEFVLGK